MNLIATLFWNTKPTLALERVSLSLRQQTELFSWHSHGGGDEGARLAEEWMQAYFHHHPQLPDLPLQQKLSDFQKKVYAQALLIPFGTTVSYSELAALIGCVQSTRAVARALATNPYPLVFPCHRIIGKNGSLCGFGEGLDVKKALLEFESESQL